MEDLFPITKIDQKTADMLAAMAALGVSKSVLLALVELTTTLSAEHRHFLSGPIVQHRSSWQDVTPDWLYKAVTGERLAIVLEEHPEASDGWKVGPAEITAVIMPASMEAPLSHEYAQIYLWASANAVAADRNLPSEEVWQMIGGTPVQDSQVTAPGGSYYHTYRKLCCDIRNRVVKASKLRTQRQAPKQSPKQSPPDSHGYALSVQPTLFDDPPSVN